MLTRFNKFPIIPMSPGEVFTLDDALGYLNLPQGYTLSVQKSPDDLSQSAISGVERANDLDLQISVSEDVMEKTIASVQVIATHPTSSESPV